MNCRKRMAPGRSMTPVKKDVSREGNGKSKYADTAGMERHTPNNKNPEWDGPGRVVEK